MSDETKTALVELAGTALTVWIVWKQSNETQGTGATAWLYRVHRGAAWVARKSGSVALRAEAAYWDRIGST